MGTSFDVGIPQTQIGIIPRAAQHLFEGIDLRREQAEEKGKPLPEFKVSAQFLEVWDIYSIWLLFSLLSFSTKFVFPRILPHVLLSFQLFDHDLWREHLLIFFLHKIKNRYLRITGGSIRWGSNRMGLKVFERHFGNSETHNCSYVFMLCQ